MADDRVKQQILDRVDQYNQQVKAIREDLNLSPRGRYQALKTLYDATAAAVTELRSQLDTNTNGDRRTLERRLFGLPANASASDAISYRDAVDRVERITKPDELGELMERATASGDTMLVRAGFARAWRLCGPFGSDGWDGLVQEYVDQNPDTRTDAEALATLSSPRHKTSAFAEQMAMSVSKPVELNRPEQTLSDQVPTGPGNAGILVRS